MYFHQIKHYDTSVVINILKRLRPHIFIRSINSYEHIHPNTTPHKIESLKAQTTSSIQAKKSLS